MRECATQPAEWRIAHVLTRLARQNGRATQGSITTGLPLRREDMHLLREQRCMLRAGFGPDGRQRACYQTIGAISRYASLNAFSIAESSRTEHGIGEASF